MYERRPDLRFTGGGPQSAAGEGRGVRLTLDQLFARKIHDHTAVRGRRDETVMFFCRYTGQRLKPVCEMGSAFGQRPLSHCHGHPMGYADVKLGSRKESDQLCGA